MAYQIMEYKPQFTYGLVNENNEIVIPVVTNQYSFSYFEVKTGITQTQLILVIISLIITLFIGIQIGKRKSKKEKKPKEKSGEPVAEAPTEKNPTCSHESPESSAKSGAENLVQFYFQPPEFKMIENGEISQDGQNKCESTADSQKKADEERSSESLSKKKLNSLPGASEGTEEKPIKKKKDQSSSTQSSPELSSDGRERGDQSFNSTNEGNRAREILENMARSRCQSDKSNGSNEGKIVEPKQWAGILA